MFVSRSCVASYASGAAWTQWDSPEFQVRICPISFSSYHLHAYIARLQHSISVTQSYHGAQHIRTEQCSLPPVERTEFQLHHCPITHRLLAGPVSRGLSSSPANLYRRLASMQRFSRVHPGLLPLLSADSVVSQPGVGRRLATRTR